MGFTRPGQLSHDYGKIHHAINGKTHYFDWAIFNSFLYVYQRVCAADSPAFLCAHSSLQYLANSIHLKNWKKRKARDARFHNYGVILALRSALFHIWA